jgi:hypothetical protein
MEIKNIILVNTRGHVITVDPSDVYEKLHKSNMITTKKEMFLDFLNSFHSISNNQRKSQKKMRFTVITLVRKYNSENSSILGFRPGDKDYEKIIETIKELKNTSLLKGKIRHTLKGTYGEMYSFPSEFYNLVLEALTSKEIIFNKIDIIEKIDDETSI